MGRLISPKFHLLLLYIVQRKPPALDTKETLPWWISGWYFLLLIALLIVPIASCPMNVLGPTFPGSFFSVRNFLNLVYGVPTYA